MVAAAAQHFLRAFSVVHGNTALREKRETETKREAGLPATGEKDEDEVHEVGLQTGRFPVRRRRRPVSTPSLLQDCFFFVARIAASDRLLMQKSACSFHFSLKPACSFGVRACLVPSRLLCGSKSDLFLHPLECKKKNLCICFHQKENVCSLLRAFKISLT